jgi:hypothetical protein
MFVAAEYVVSVNAPAFARHVRAPVPTAKSTLATTIRLSARVVVKFNVGAPDPFVLLDAPTPPESRINKTSPPKKPPPTPANDTVTAARDCDATFVQIPSQLKFVTSTDCCNTQPAGESAIPLFEIVTVVPLLSVIAYATNTSFCKTLNAAVVFGVVAVFQTVVSASRMNAEALIQQPSA